MRDEGASSEGSAAGPPSGAIQGASGSPSTTADGRVGPGWYADPNTDGQLRYWDGQAWTSAVAAISDVGARPQPGADGSPFVKQPPAHAPNSGLWERNLPEKDAFDRLQQALRQCGGEVTTNEREGWIEATLLWKGTRRRHRFTFDDARHTVWVTGTDGSASFASLSQGDDALREEMLARVWSLYAGTGPRSVARRGARRGWLLVALALGVLAGGGAGTAIVLNGHHRAPSSSSDECDGGSGCTDDGHVLALPDDSDIDGDQDVQGGDLSQPTFSAAALQAISANAPGAGITVDVYDSSGGTRPACDITWDIVRSIAPQGVTLTQANIDATVAPGGNGRFQMEQLTNNDVDAVATALGCMQEFVGRTTY